MGLDVALQDESGEEQRAIRDDGNLLLSLIGEPGFCDSPMISLIRRYGETTFNRLQAQQFVAEWKLVGERAARREETEVVARVAELAQAACESQHLYLKFRGS